MVRPLALKHWGQSPNQGHSPFTIFRNCCGAEPRLTSGGKAGADGVKFHQQLRVGYIFQILDPGLSLALQPWAGISERLRRCLLRYKFVTRQIQARLRAGGALEGAGEALLVLLFDHALGNEERQTIDRW